MPLFGPKKSPPFEPFKSKTYLKCATARLKQETAKKQNANKVMAKELGALLKDGKEEMARIRVEHLIRSTNEIHGLEIVELFCDLLLARHVSPNQPSLRGSLRFVVALTSSSLVSCAVRARSP